MSNESNEEWVKRKAKEDMEKTLKGKTTTPQGTEISIEVDKEFIQQEVKKAMGNEGKEAQELLEDIKMKAVLEWEKKTGELLEPTEISLDEAKRLIKACRIEKEPQTSSGNSPLAGQYLGSNQSDLYHKKFDSYEEMIDTLRAIERDSEHPSQKDAQLILNELVARHFALRKVSKGIPESEQKMPTIAELTRKKKR